MTDMVKPLETLDNEQMKSMWETKAAKVVYIFIMNVDEDNFRIFKV